MTREDTLCHVVEPVVITRRGALAASSPSIVVLLGFLAWHVIDRRHELVDRLIRAVDVARD